MASLSARVRLVSNALILLGDQPIASLTEDRTGATLGANLFENTYLAMLQNHRWRFAAKSQQLARLAVKPTTGYNYAFALPADMLYAIKGDSRKYEVYGREIHCDATTFQLDYIHRVEEDKLPAYFAKALEFNLAKQFAVPLTGDVDKGSYYGQAADNEIKKAKFTDSTQYPEVAVQDSPYTNIRF